MSKPSNKDLGLTFDETGFSVRGCRYEWDEFGTCRAGVNADTKQYDTVVISKGTDTKGLWGGTATVLPPVYYSSAALAESATERINEEYKKHLDASGA